MVFEKNTNNYSDVMPRAGCSGCSDKEEAVMRGNRTNQGSNKAQRCSNCQ